uniref:Ubiquitin carrier protein n=1 Tax=Solanum tuberosum TaxID=4113 RepID=M1CNZ9_SOLTU
MKWVENHEDSRFKSRQRQNIGELFPSVLALMDKVTFIPIADGRFRTAVEDLKRIRSVKPGSIADVLRCWNMDGYVNISELNLPKTCSISFPNGKDDLMNFEVTIRPDEGYYMGGTFTFSFSISPIYPHEAPKVKCKTKVYHPNIDLEGNVCLNILREDWKPVLNINTIIYGLYHLFTEPNHEDPLNHDAAAVLRDNPKMFESNVRRAMHGGYVGQTFFTRCM